MLNLILGLSPSTYNDLSLHDRMVNVSLWIREQKLVVILPFDCKLIIAFLWLWAVKPKYRIYAISAQIIICGWPQKWDCAGQMKP